MRHGLDFCHILHGETGSRESSAVTMNHARPQDAHSSYRDEGSRSASGVAERSGSYALESALMTKALIFAVIVLMFTSVMAALM